LRHSQDTYEVGTNVNDIHTNLRSKVDSVIHPISL
jgi:hypothetical protein